LRKPGTLPKQSLREQGYTLAPRVDVLPVKDYGVSNQSLTGQVVRHKTNPTNKHLNNVKIYENK
jgi:hypothetical protein